MKLLSDVVGDTAIGVPAGCGDPAEAGAASVVGDAGTSGAAVSRAASDLLVFGRPRSCWCAALLSAPTTLGTVAEDGTFLFFLVSIAT